MSSKLSKAKSEGQLGKQRGSYKVKLHVVVDHRYKGKLLEEYSAPTMRSLHKDDIVPKSEWVRLIDMNHPYVPKKWGK